MEGQAAARALSSPPHTHTHTHLAHAGQGVVVQGQVPLASRVGAGSQDGLQRRPPGVQVRLCLGHDGVDQAHDGRGQGRELGFAGLG